MSDTASSARAARLGAGLLLLAYACFELRPFLQDGLPLFFDAHSHLTRAWLAARSLAADSYPSWTFEWYGGFRLFDFYAPGYSLLTAGLGFFAGDLALATKLVLVAGQAFSVVAFYAFLIRLGAAPLAALFGALLYLHDAERWRLLAVIGNYPSVFVYAFAPLLLLTVLRADGTRRSELRLFAASSLLLAAMAIGHLTNTAQVLPALLAFAVAALIQRLPRPAAGRALVALAASVVALGGLTLFLTVPMLRGLHLVSLSLDTTGLGFDPESVKIALGLSPGSLRRIFVVTPGAFWCALALGAGCLSLRGRFEAWRAPFVGLGASLLSLALIGERAALGMIFFVAALCAAALEIASWAVESRTGRRVALALQVLAVAAVPVWHHTREQAPLRYVEPQTLAIYQRFPERISFGRSFDVTPTTDSLDGVYGQSSFSPYWSGRAIPFGGFPQGAPLASNVQLALVGKLVQELAAPRLELSTDSLDLLQLLHVEWLVDRQEPPRLAGLALAADAAEHREPGLLRLRNASPALFAPRLEERPEIGSLLARLEARWASDPQDDRGQRSLDALSRTGTKRDWALVLPLLQGMQIDRARGRAARFFVERGLPSAEPADASTAEFAVLAHEEQIQFVGIHARSSVPGFVRLAYGFDPGLGVTLDGEAIDCVPDFLGGIVLPFPAGTHVITLTAPPATLQLSLLGVSVAIAAALVILWALCRP